MGTASGMTWVAGALASLIGSLLLPVSLAAALTVYAGAFLLGGLAVLAGRVESRGQPLADILDEPAAGSDHAAP
jgi:hypothetical protein